VSVEPVEQKERTAKLALLYWLRRSMEPQRTRALARKVRYSAPLLALAMLVVISSRPKTSVVVAGGGGGDPGSYADAPNAFYNSAEEGCDGSDADVLMCEDFERPPGTGAEPGSGSHNWYAMNCDVANGAPGGRTENTKGWCPTIYQDTLMRIATTVCGSKGFRSNCASTTGPIPGPCTQVEEGPCDEVFHDSAQGNMADHGFPSGAGYDSVTVRLFFYAETGFLWGGGQKFLTFNRGSPGGGGIHWGSFGWNCQHGDDDAGVPTMGWSAPNIGFELCQGASGGFEMQDGHWYGMIIQQKLSTDASTPNGYFRAYIDDFGTDGLTSVPTPTLRIQNDTIRHPRATFSGNISTLWFESWGAPRVTGSWRLDNIKVCKFAADCPYIMN
jgi:hypothetical protein